MTVIDRNDIDRLDREDDLAAMRERFHLPEGLIYLDGNSLGPAPMAVFAEIDQAVREEWATRLISSWDNAGWFDLPRSLGARIARLIGAGADEVVVSDSTSINVFKALHAALALNPGRNVIVAEQGGFPTDLYIAQAIQSRDPRLSLRLEGRDGDSIEDLLDEDVAVLLVNHVDYRSGVLRDMAALTRHAQAAGALVVWDLCHSAGAMPVDLNGAGADFAVGCSYKYLNGGPGAPAFIYAAQRHHGKTTQPLSGWWAHLHPFAFDSRFEADIGMGAFLCGTQPILSLRALKPALAIFDDVDLARLREKSKRLTGVFIELVEQRCAGHGISLLSPRAAEKRGSQVALRHEHGYPIIRALIERKVVGDFRAPDVMRFGFAPLYLSYRDVWDAVERLRDILASGIWREPRFSVRGAVT
ncbi:MAG: kynureninase [Rhodospirillaceae bacterium]|jgi:kynureninase|nr:kynureninase [Rhodospirillaceae bacterium]